MSDWCRFRFQANHDDYRPVLWPPLGPYWCIGYGDGYSIVVAFFPMDQRDRLTEFWPEAEDIETEFNAEPVFTERFPKPDWWDDVPALRGEDQS